MVNKWVLKRHSYTKDLRRHSGGKAKVLSLGGSIVLYCIVLYCIIYVSVSVPSSAAGGAQIPKENNSCLKKSIIYQRKLRQYLGLSTY